MSFSTDHFEGLSVNVQLIGVKELCPCTMSHQCIIPKDNVQLPLFNNIADTKKRG